MRLHVLLAAGGVHLAVPAERVRRVRADVGEGLPLADALGLPPVPPAATVDLEAPPGALLVDRVLGVVDTSRSVPARLPAASRGPGAVFDRALLLDGELYLELDPARLLAAPEGAGGAGPRSDRTPSPGPLGTGLPAMPAQALVFPVGDRSFAAPFGVVLGVLEAPRLFPVPRAPACHRGVTLHAGALVSVLDLPAALGEPDGPQGRFAVLVEADAGPVGLVATGPGRVVSGLLPAEEVPGLGRWLAGPAGERIFLPRQDRFPLGGGGAAAQVRPPQD